jgi:hypothetical protein
MSEVEATAGRDPTAAPLRDRRAYVRLASDLSSTARPAGHSREVGWPGRVRDISQGGIGLLLRHRFRPGTMLEVELRSNTGAPLRTVSVRVVHATAVLMDGNPCWLLGCAFEQPLSDDEFRGLT